MAYCQGDVVVNEYPDPIGHEPAYSRPALVVSDDYFNMGTSMVMLCPITSSRNEFPLHIPLPEGMHVEGRVVTEHLRAFDLEYRRARIIDHLDTDSDTMRAVLECIHSFF